ncbi:DM13 domain-containing protein [Saccharopolyspora indica]|uniref:DM13 domain-containing protein n=1 Tax=Saccharopolyspora indica TaxID=1229659 RepID=UPI0022EA75CE|nr:DM13 domain-containing protein [Saccharopolyspora indica]MDA3646896.1 DM13 domain-containing protein [Saccharopolyspora indica]
MTRRSLVRHPAAWAVVVVVVLVIGAAAWAFQPWRLWTSTTVDEALPPAPTVVVPEVGQAPVELAAGEFVTQEHETSGAARVLKLPDGSLLLRLDELATSDGPDLHVWLTDQTAGGDWHKYDDGRYVALGQLKGNRGNQNYVIPPDAQLPGLTSVVIWCDRFNVAFGSAPLAL